MPISDLPISSMLRTRMQWHQERQRLLAENVANADTPNYRARDLAPPEFRPCTLKERRDQPRAHRGRPYRSGRRCRLAISPRMEIATMRCARAAPP